MPVTAWVCRGEMHGCAQGTVIPPYAGWPSMVPLWTAGSVVTIPMPAGTVWRRPLTKTSRCACTWYWRPSAVSGTRPAAVTSPTTRSGEGASQRGVRLDADAAFRSPDVAAAGVTPEISATTTNPSAAHPVNAFCTLDLSITRDAPPGSRPLLDRIPSILDGVAPLQKSGARPGGGHEADRVGARGSRTDSGPSADTPRRADAPSDETGPAALPVHGRALRRRRSDPSLPAHPASPTSVIRPSRSPRSLPPRGDAA